MCELIQYPTGRWGFVGQVAVGLLWKNKDGSPLTDKQAAEVLSMTNPAMKYAMRTFATEKDAREAEKTITKGG